MFMFVFMFCFCLCVLVFYSMVTDFTAVFLSLSSSVFVCTQTPISRLLRQHMLGVLCIRNLKFNVFVFIFVIDFCFCLHLCH